MKTTESTHQVHESTYALLVRSEEKERSLFEIIAYGLFILSAIAAIWQFVQQPLKLPLDNIPQTASVASTLVKAHS